MIESYRKPSVKFMANKGNFNKILGILSFQIENIVTPEWKEKATTLKDTLLKYSIPQKDEEGDVAIIDMSLYPNEASELLVLLISSMNVKPEEDYTKLMKRK